MRELVYVVGKDPDASLNRWKDGWKWHRLGTRRERSQEGKDHDRPGPEHLVLEEGLCISASELGYSELKEVVRAVGPSKGLTVYYLHHD